LILFPGDFPWLLSIFSSSDVLFHHAVIASVAKVVPALLDKFTWKMRECVI
jgi:hypothetical protein